MTIRMISLGPFATKGHSSDLLISPTSLAQSGTDPHKYLLTTQQIEAVTTDSLEILDYMWMMSSSFCRAPCVSISSLHTLNLGEAKLNSFIVGPLVSDQSSNEHIDVVGLLLLRASATMGTQ
jgi:hypothetical protein